MTQPQSSSEKSAGGRKTYPRTARLLRSGEFERVYREGRRRSSKQFVVFARAAAAGPAGSRASRFGWSVKRALGGAMVRNRIRRRVREIVRLHRSDLPAGYDVVIHPRATVADAEFAALSEELVNLIRSAVK